MAPTISKPQDATQITYKFINFCLSLKDEAELLPTAFKLISDYSKLSVDRKCLLLMCATDRMPVERGKRAKSEQRKGVSLTRQISA